MVAQPTTETPNGDAPPDPASVSDSTAGQTAPSKLGRDSAAGRRGPSRLASWRDDVELGRADWPILACCVVSGLCDSCAFNAGGVFVSMQTGNTIFLALGASLLPADLPHLWLKALVSISAFWLGCFIFGRVRDLVGGQRKASLAATFFVQTAFVVVAAALSQAGAVPAFALSNLEPHRSHSSGGGGEGDKTPVPESDLAILAPLALLAFQFGGQIVASRNLGFNEVPTNVLTSVYCDLFSDPRLFAPPGTNAKRDRRLWAVVLMLGGGIAGGWLQRSAAGMSAALWIAAAIKGVISIAWLFWTSRAPAVGEGRKGPGSETGGKSAEPVDEEKGKAR